MEKMVVGILLDLGLGWGMLLVWFFVIGWPLNAAIEHIQEAIACKLYLTDSND